MNYIGIDPGASGGVAVLTELGLSTVAKLPDSERDVADLLRNATADPCVIVVEKVGGYIGGGEVCPACKQARNRSPGSSMFNFGRGVGVIVGCLLSLGKDFAEVEPQQWQATLGLKRPKSCSQVQWKRELKKRAAELYPQHKVTLSLCDALLIARYAKITSEGFAAGVPLGDDA